LDKNYVPLKPDQIKISLALEVSDGKEKDFSFYVTPYNGESVEFFLTETWNQYEKQAKAKLPASKRQDGPTHFRLLPLALGVTATTKWNKVLDAQGINMDLDNNEPSQLTYKKFEHCVTLFLEEVAGQKFLGDGIICWLRRGRRPMRMSPDVAFDRRATLLALLDCGLLPSKLLRPNAYELADAIFLAFPTAYQEKYVDSHEDIGEDLDLIRAAFTQSRLFLKGKRKRRDPPMTPAIGPTRGVVALTSIPPAEADKEAVLASTIAPIVTLIVRAITIAPIATVTIVETEEASSALRRMAITTRVAIMTKARPTRGPTTTPIT
jgi:hypothetical protein